MEFVALDLETANAGLSSICQIGLAHYIDGNLLDTWKTYINPEDEFDPINISIHGITEDTVRGAPTIPDVADRLQNQLSTRIVVCHTHFDRVALQQSFSKYQLKNIDCTWLDTAMVTRRAWEEFAYSGYGLHNVCTYLGYEFSHHDALEDAKAAGYILIAAIEKSGLDVSGWLERVRRPIGSSETGGLSRKGNPEGPLYNEVMVFTGSLSIPRRQAADLAARIGCEVAEGVNKKTTMLVVGDQDINRLAGHEKSTKHRKAEDLIMAGQPIKILKESDFMAYSKLIDSA